MSSSPSSVSPSLVLGLCILGACVACVIAYAISRMMRVKILNEHEESPMTTNPFHDLSQEQREYMHEVRIRNNEDAWERACEALGYGAGGKVKTETGRGANKVVSECFEWRR